MAMKQTPVSESRFRMHCVIGDAPRYRGNSDAWMLTHPAAGSDRSSARSSWPNEMTRTISGCFRLRPSRYSGALTEAMRSASIPISAAAEATGVNYYVRNNTLYGSSAHPIEDLSILDTMFDRYKDEPAFVGNYGDDEPPTTKFQYLRTLKDKYEEVLPGKDLLINLLPTYASSAQLGADSYEEYIQTYIDVMDPDYVMYDHYPLLKGANDKESSIREDFLRNLEVVAYLTSNAGIDFYNFIQVGAHMSYRDTEGYILFYILVSVRYICIFW